MLAPTFLQHLPTRFEQNFCGRLNELSATRQPSSTAAIVLAEYAEDFPGFCRDVLGMPTWTAQDRMVEYLLKYRQVSVAGCHASGKTYIAAAIIIWWLMTRDPAFVVTTAPGGRQVRVGLWRIVGKLWRAAKRKLSGRCLTQEIRISDTRMGLGFATVHGDASQGMREAANVLVIEDEATSVEDQIHDSLCTLRTDSSSRHLLLGNPTTQSGHFYDAHHKLRSDGDEPGWHCIEIDALESPNVVEGRIVIPGLIDRSFVDEARRKWGEDSPQYKQRIRGQWVPVTGENLVIPAPWVKQLQENWDTTTDDPAAPRILAVDVAASTAGDQTSQYLAAGRRISEVESYHEDNLMENAKRIAQNAIQLRVQRLHVDATGVGKGCFQKLQEIQEAGGLAGIELVGVCLGESAGDDTFYRKLSETQWAMRMAFDPHEGHGWAIDPADTELADQLCWRIWWLDDGGKKTRVESKKELRKRTGKSPDKADAVMLIFYDSRDLIFV